MKDGYYWMIQKDDEPEVVQIDGDSMNRCGSDLSCHFENGQWIECCWKTLDIVSFIGPITPPSMEYYIDEAHGICLPTGLDVSTLTTITTIADRWAVLLDPATQKIYRCADYYAEYQKQNKAG